MKETTTMSASFFLVPTAAILGGPDLHVDKGSTINLTCTIRYSPEPPAYIFWYHHDEVSRLSKLSTNVHNSFESYGYMDLSI